MDIKQEELGDMVEKEMASTSAAIEDAVRRIEVRQSCGMGPWAAKCLLLPGVSPPPEPCLQQRGVPPFFSHFPTGDDEPSQERKLWHQTRSERAVSVGGLPFQSCSGSNSGAGWCSETSHALWTCIFLMLSVKLPYEGWAFILHV